MKKYPYVWAVVDKKDRTLQSFAVGGDNKTCAIFFRKADALELLDKRKHEAVRVKVVAS